MHNNHSKEREGRERDKTRQEKFFISEGSEEAYKCSLHSALAQRGTNLLRIHTANAILHTLKTCTLSIKNSKEKRTREKNQQKQNKANKQNEQTNKSQEGTQNTEGGREREREREGGREGEREGEMGEEGEGEHDS